MPKAALVPPVNPIPGGEACPSSGEKHAEVVAVAKAENGTSNQCVSEDWREYFVPSLDAFEDGCSSLFKCWGMLACLYFPFMHGSR